MNTKIIGIGEYWVSKTPGDAIKTLALGSCVAVIIVDHDKKSAGMIHIALPRSGINPERARKSPGIFADTGMPAIIEAMTNLGSTKKPKTWSVKLVGGAKVMDTKNIFKIGKANSSRIS